MNTRRLHEDPNRTTPIGLLRFASEFIEAALAADDKMGAKEGYEIVAPIPVMFLVGQSIELALKVYLVANGVTLRQLRTDYGHELHGSLRKPKSLVFSMLFRSMLTTSIPSNCLIIHTQASNFNTLLPELNSFQSLDRWNVQH